MRVMIVVKDRTMTTCAMAGLGIFSHADLSSTFSCTGALLGASPKGLAEDPDCAKGDPPAAGADPNALVSAKGDLPAAGAAGAAVAPKGLAGLAPPAGGVAAPKGLAGLAPSAAGMSKGLAMGFVPPNLFASKGS